MLFLWAAVKYDVFIFAFGKTIIGLPAIELPLLALLRRRTIFVFHGSDTRPPYIDGAVPLTNADGGQVDIARRAARAKRRLRVIERYATAMIDHPPSAQFHERRCVHWLIMGVPSAQVAARPAPVGDRSRVRVLHAPSNLEAKGTIRIREIITALQAEGLPIEYVEISGVPHDQVMAALSSADLVVDQLYSDTPMAALAVEAAWHGKPAVVGGYAAAELRRFYRAELLPPTIYCHPDDVPGEIRRLVLDPAARVTLGDAARRYLLERWRPAQVAERFISVIDGSAPADWFFDPRDIEYSHGVGLTETRLGERCAQVLSARGATGFQVDDKPQLKDALVSLARASRVVSSL